MDVRFFIRDAQQEGGINVSYIQTESQLADIFTKALASQDSRDSVKNSTFVNFHDKLPFVQISTKNLNLWIFGDFLCNTHINMATYGGSRLFPNFKLLKFVKN